MHFGLIARLAAARAEWAAITPLGGRDRGCPVIDATGVRVAFPANLASGSRTPDTVGSPA